ncbi:hypothetical protein GWK47_021812 [Chionoecetes opilio]|uniref:Uncharacterized protein n=1 Tax=Chionoecetes opilio TaxID=41210 RepID=A0A8J4XP50_CHIOP|nr:hypothetical protein GWK47_021812 [Chionoecetes opilio]
MSGYLSEDLIGLSLFDSRLPCLDKQAIVQWAILSDEGAKETAQANKPPSHKFLAGNTALLRHEKFLSLFEVLSIKTDFLSANPRKWKRRGIVRRSLPPNPEGTSRRSTTKAERGVALISPATSDDQRRGTAPVPPPSCGGPSPSTARDSKASLPRPSRP